MKKILFILSIVFLVNTLQSQAPQYMNYQGVARNSSGTIINSGNVGLKFEILQGSTAVYSEEQSASPSAAGIFTAAIGSGTNVSGSFSSINWANGPYSIRVSLDPSGGTSFTNVGTSQLLSVPYSLYAEKAGSVNLSSGTGISISSGSIINTAPNQTVNITGANVTGTYPDYTITAAPSTSYSAGTGISVTGSVIANTAPDQTVTITGPGVSGAYPNFNIATPAPTSITANGSSILVSGSDPNFTLTPSYSLNVTGNQLSITDGNTVTLPTGTTYTNGAGIAFISGTVITNSAPDQTVTIGNGINTNVTGTYPNFVVDATPSLSISSNTLSITGGNSVTLPSPPTPTAGTGISITSGTITNTAPDLTVTIGSGINTNVTGTYPNFVVDATPSLSIAGNTLSITGGTSVVLPAPPVLLPGGGIAINSGSIINTAPDQTVTLTGLGSTTVSGTYPNFSINTPAALTPSTGISINSGTITNTAPNQTVTLTGLGSTTIGGTYPNFSISTPLPAAPPVITGTGAASVTTAGNNYTVNVPNPTYNNNTGAFVTGTNTISVVPSLGISGNTLTSGPSSNSVIIPSYSAGSGLLLSGSSPNFSLGLSMTGTNTAWNTLGNTGTSAGTSFLGTTDAQDLVFKTANNQRMRLFNSNGYVGIGNITTISELLQVETGSNTAISVLSGSNSSLYLGNAGNHSLGRIDYNTTTNVMSFGTNGASGLVGIDANGRLGVGTTGPGENVQVQSNGNTDVSILSPGGSLASLAFGFTGNHFMGRLQYDINNNSLNFWTNNTPNRMFINNNGLVAIGHNSPGYQLDIQSNSANLLKLTTTAANTNVKIDAFPTGSSSELQISSIASGMSFITNSAIRVKIDGTGNVGIGGVTTPLGRLDILGGNTYFRPNGGNPNALLVQDFTGTAMRLYTDALAGTPYDLILGTYPNGHLNQLFLKQSNGFVGVGTSAPSSKLHVNGAITITDGTEGAGKILTSNATGVASWQNPPPKVGFHAGTNPVSNQNISANVVTTVQYGAGINFFNDGGGYNTGTFKFTPPSAGVYQIACHLSITGSPGATLQVWISTPAGWVARCVENIPNTGNTVISLSATVNSAVTGGPYWVEIVSNGAMQVQPYDSSFSGHKIY